jgi:hypothetical protein
MQPIRPGQAVIVLAAFELWPAQRMLRVVT